MEKWAISIISTGYDLTNLRRSLSIELENLDFKILAYERNNFPVAPGMHSHDACIEAIQYADIVILLINQRFGGKYKNTDISVTEKEYEKALELNKLIIPCVNIKSEQERHCLFNFLKNLDLNFELDLNEIKEKCPPAYVANWKVLDFIEKIRKAYKDNFYIEYNSNDDLIQKIKGRLQGLSVYICHEILERKIKTIESIKTTTFKMSLGDVLNKGYFMEPPFIIHSGREGRSDLSEICDLKTANNKIMIMAKLGSGKTTILAKTFLNHAQSLNSSNRRIPFYKSLRGIGPNYHFDFKLYLEECCNEYLEKEAYPLMNTNNIQPIFYIDGFDEIVEQSASVDTTNIVKSKFFTSPFIICSRLYFAEDQLQDSDFANSIETIISLEPWDRSLALKYIKKFGELQGNNNLEKELRNYFDENNTIYELFENPLMLTIYLWILEHSNMKLPLNISDTVSLYDEFINRWIKRECKRNSLKRRSEDNILKILQMTSWQIYITRINKNEFQLNDFDKMLENAELYLDKSQLNVIFEFLDYQLSRKMIRGMLHEQLMEFLLAKELTIALLNKSGVFPEFLQYEMGYEINKLLRAIWKNKSDDDNKKILENLWDEYQKNVSNENSSKIAIRNHAMYYLGRLPLTESIERLKTANKQEQNTFVKLSIAFGLIKFKDFGVEQELFEKLNSEFEWDKANRGYHMVYYGDWILTDEEPPYLDDESILWARTFRALKRHICSKEVRHIALRRVELYTIRRFIETRKSVVPLTKEDLKEIETTINNNPGSSEEFFQKVKQEFTELEKAYTANKKDNSKIL